jgi:hypothetical protein
MFGLWERHRNEFLHAKVFMDTVMKPNVTFLRSIDIAGKRCPILKIIENRAESVKTHYGPTQEHVWAMGRALFARDVCRPKKK